MTSRDQPGRAARRCPAHPAGARSPGPRTTRRRPSGSAWPGPPVRGADRHHRGVPGRLRAGRASRRCRSGRRSRTTCPRRRRPRPPWRCCTGSRRSSTSRSPLGTLPDAGRGVGARGHPDRRRGRGDRRVHRAALEERATRGRAAHRGVAARRSPPSSSATCGGGATHPSATAAAEPATSGPGRARPASLPERVVIRVARCPNGTTGPGARILPPWRRPATHPRRGSVTLRRCRPAMSPPRRRRRRAEHRTSRPPSRRTPASSRSAFTGCPARPRSRCWTSATSSSRRVTRWPASTARPGRNRCATTLGDRSDGPWLEAYSWGGWTSGARTRALWIVLLPFALINVAPRMLPPTRLPGADHPADQPTDEQRLGVGRRHWFVCGALRVLSLSLTVTLVFGLCQVALITVGRGAPCCRTAGHPIRASVSGCRKASPSSSATARPAGSWVWPHCCRCCCSGCSGGSARPPPSATRMSNPRSTWSPRSGPTTTCCRSPGGTCGGGSRRIRRLRQLHVQAGFATIGATLGGVFPWRYSWGLVLVSLGILAATVALVSYRPANTRPPVAAVRPAGLARAGRGCGRRRPDAGLRRRQHGVAGGSRSDGRDHERLADLDLRTADPRPVRGGGAGALAGPDGSQPGHPDAVPRARHGGVRPAGLPVGEPVRGRGDAAGADLAVHRLAGSVGQRHPDLPQRPSGLVRLRGAERRLRLRGRGGRADPGHGAATWVARSGPGWGAPPRPTSATSTSSTRRRCPTWGCPPSSSGTGVASPTTTTRACMPGPGAPGRSGGLLARPPGGLRAARPVRAGDRTWLGGDDPGRRHRHELLLRHPHPIPGRGRGRPRPGRRPVATRVGGLGRVPRGARRGRVR